MYQNGRKEYKEVLRDDSPDHIRAGESKSDRNRKEKGGSGVRANLKEARRKAGMTQQQMADRLEISLRYYQNIESGDRTGDFVIWDTLEDITGIHQRKLRETS